MNIKHKKLDDFVYTIPRYPWTPLTIEELRYCQNDVLGLVEAIKEEMKRDGDTLLTIPYTSTGYVRRDFKQALKDAGFFYRWADDYFPSPHLYHIMKKAFRGGDTHGNRWYAERIMHDVHSYDRSSSYPDVICNRPFPVTPFEWVDIKDLDRVRELRDKHNRAFLLRVRLKDVKLISDYWGDPYLTEDKSEHIVNPRIYNGRILSADSLETCITDIDLRIIDETYSYKSAVVLDCYKSTYGMLPECMRNLTKEYYRRKTELKGVDKYQYDRAKAKLNAIYGMTCQDCIKIPLLYDGVQKKFIYDLETPEEELFKTQKKNYWLPYQYGIFTTSWARYELFCGIKTVSMVTNPNKDSFSDFVYCDTDSVKFFGEADFTSYNEERKKNSIKNGAFATDSKGVTHYMGVFEREEDYKTFKHLGAKRYGGVIDGKLQLTIAGVSKAKGAKELEERGGLEELNRGFVFYEAGGLNAQYNDVPPVTEWEVDGHTLEITSNVYLYPSVYEMTEVASFIRLMLISKEDIDLCFKLMYNELVGGDDPTEDQN